MHHIMFISLCKNGLIQMDEHFYMWMAKIK